jgi:hypothetical protein
MINLSEFYLNKTFPAHLSHFIILHIYNLNEEDKQKKRKGERVRGKKKKNENDNLGKDR